MIFYKKSLNLIYLKIALIRSELEFSSWNDYLPESGNLFESMFNEDKKTENPKMVECDTKNNGKRENLSYNNLVEPFSSNFGENREMEHAEFSKNLDVYAKKDLSTNPNKMKDASTNFSSLVSNEPSEKLTQALLTDEIVDEEDIFDEDKIAHLNDNEEENDLSDE
jgi:hypothetical protein